MLKRFFFVKYERSALLLIGDLRYTFAMDDIDPLTAMWTRWNHIQPSLFPWLREEIDPLTEMLARLMVVLDSVGLQAFVPAPSSGSGRPPEDRCALARAFVGKVVPGIPTTRALIECLAVDKS